MSTTMGRVFTGVTRLAFIRRIFIHKSTASARFDCVRSLAVSAQMSARSKEGEEEVNNEPIKFSTSKASHKTWKVARSMGSEQARPWWKVLPISLVGAGFLLWCAMRQETDIDSQLEKQLYEHLPNILSEEQQEEVQNKSA